MPTNPLDPTRFVVVADQFVVTDGVDSEAPFVIEGGVVKMIATRAGIITSFDGTSMYVDFDNLEFFMQG